MVNLLISFRVSLFESIFTFHTHAGWANHAVDILLAWLLEFKAVTLFSFLFGVGVGVQAERAALGKINASSFFLRRFVILLAIGLCHMFLIWNGDILALYAVCGMLLIPFAAISSRRLVAAGIVLIVVSPFLPFFNDLIPSEAEMRAHAVIATRVYATGSFTEIMAMRFGEAWRFIAPLLLSFLPRTFGLMLFGIGAWRSGVLQHPAKRRKLLLIILVVTGSLGALTTTLEVWSEHTGRPPGAFDFFEPYSTVLLAFAYGAGLFLYFNSPEDGHARRLTRLFAGVGRMTLSNYLAQSIIFSAFFYGLGLGLFGKLGSAVAALLGLAVYAAQLITSDWWLARYRYGPAEWLWRSLTYGRWQPMTRGQMRDGNQ
ncbi:MAG TPA: DUF418 domain-containing protein, partial [Blastocatellia bacterium]|nr:DUF418 domain-containing protein [Blastocatellia bacterium]